MKRTIRIIDPKGKVLEKTFNTRDLAHLEACLKYKSKIEQPKKGKGSYKRNKRIIIDENF